MTGPIVRHTVNPFLLPGYEDAPLLPLCPWQQPAHDDYFVGVDHTQEAFDEFTGKMTNILSLRTYGRLVLVTGGSGCGKSALINRCAHWTQTMLRKEDVQGKLVDLTREGTPGRQRSAEERMTLVCERLHDELDQKLLDKGDLEYLAANVSRPDLVYPRLGKVLDDSVVLIIMLPPMGDVINEVATYARLARRKVLFFAESTLLSDEELAGLRRVNQVPVPPVMLRVGELKTGDAHAFVMNRLNRHRTAGVYPAPDEQTLVSLERNDDVPWTIALLQRVFATVYGDRLRRDHGYGEDGLVTFNEIVRAVFDGRDFRPPSGTGQ